jgi:serine/threonine protein kinase
VSKFVDTKKPDFHTFCGTIYYMAPENFMGAMYDKSVDTWALGMIFYEMAMMKIPFTEVVSCQVENSTAIDHFFVPRTDNAS